MRKSRKRLMLFAFGAILLLLVFLGYQKISSNGAEEGPKTVEVTRATIVEKALAVGTIEPEYEVSVKSKISGVVERRFADEGDFVKMGAPLLEIKPDPTPLELAEAKRQVEMAQIAYETAARERNRVQDLISKNLVSQKEFDQVQQRFQENKLKLSMAKEKLALIEKGKVRIAETEIESIIKSPIDGFILECTVEIGDPVVPLTSYQAGTVLMTIADMKSLIFKGTIDEIDVGKIREGLPAEIDIGALPGDDKIKGTVRKISLKAKKEDNLTVFPVEIELAPANGTVLRAGYSANANIIIARKENVLALPERVITFRNDSALVKVLQEDGSTKEVAVETGLSDAINIEIVSGLSEGQKILEKPVKEIR